MLSQTPSLSKTVSQTFMPSKTVSQTFAFCKTITPQSSSHAIGTARNRLEDPVCVGPACWSRRGGIGRGRWVLDWFRRRQQIK